jgi:hypothetical protein
MYPTLTDALFYTMASQELKARGWPVSLKAEYSLTWCQGDGVLFTGRLLPEALLGLIPQLVSRGHLSMQHSGRLQSAVRRNGVTVDIRRSGNYWYCHSGCVTFSDDGFTDNDTDLQNMLRNALRDDFEQLCAEVVTKGYQLIEASSPAEHEEVLFCRMTRNLEFIAHAVPQEDMGWSDAGEETLAEYVRQIQDEGVRILAIRLSIKCHGAVMGVSHVGEVVIRKGRKPRHWLPREEIQYVTSEARTVISEHVSAFHSFMKAA